MPKRKSEIALFSLLMCVLVIFIHVTSWTLTAMDRTSVKYLLLLFPWRLSAFVVQGFVFLSGVRLFLSAKPFAYGQFLRGRVRRILLPYLVWIAVYYAYFIRIGWYRFSFRDLAEYVFLGTLCSHFYFVVIILQFYLLMPLWRRLLDRVDTRLLCGAAILLTAAFKLFVHFRYDDRVFPAYLCWFLLGAAVGRHYDAAVTWLKAHLVPLGAAFVVTAAADLYFTWRSQCFGAVYPWFEALHLAYAMTAIFFCFAVFAKLCAGGAPLPAFFALCDRSSYLIYLAHVLPIYAANDLIARSGGMGMAEAYLFRFVFTYAVTFGGCLGYTFVKEKIKERLQNAHGCTNQRSD